MKHNFKAHGENKISSEEKHPSTWSLISCLHHGKLEQNISDQLNEKGSAEELVWRMVTHQPW